MVSPEFGATGSQLSTAPAQPERLGLMELEFVNHASLIVTAGRERIISDPWLEGEVFNDGWALISATRHVVR